MSLQYLKACFSNMSRTSSRQSEFLDEIAAFQSSLFTMRSIKTSTFGIVFIPSLKHTVDEFIASDQLVWNSFSENVLIVRNSELILQNSH